MNRKLWGRTMAARSSPMGGFLFSFHFGYVCVGSLTWKKQIAKEITPNLCIRKC